VGAPSNALGELWMELRNRKRLVTLMVVQERSQRQVAAAAGWSSHSYLGRLIRGEVKTLEPEAAIRIARYLGVGTDDLFVAHVSTEGSRSARQRRARGRTKAAAA
jgi:transcriptional regulator with XRE-family HTH domain